MGRIVFLKPNKEYSIISLEKSVCLFEWDNIIRRFNLDKPRLIKRDREKIHFRGELNNEN